MTDPEKARKARTTGYVMVAVAGALIVASLVMTLRGGGGLATPFLLLGLVLNTAGSVLLARARRSGGDG